MSQLSGILLKRARLVPSSMFASPDAVVKSARLTLAQKIEILRRWEFDARGMTEAKPTVEARSDTSLIDQLRSALKALSVRARRARKKGVGPRGSVRTA